MDTSSAASASGPQPARSTSNDAVCGSLNLCHQPQEAQSAHVPMTGFTSGCHLRWSAHANQSTSTLHLRWWSIDGCQALARQCLTKSLGAVWTCGHFCQARQADADPRLRYARAAQWPKRSLRDLDTAPTLANAMEHQRYLEQLSYESSSLSSWSQMIADQIQLEREVAHDNLASVLESLSQDQSDQCLDAPRSDAKGKSSRPTTPAGPPPQRPQPMSSSPAPSSGSPLPVKPAPAGWNTGTIQSSSSVHPPANQHFHNSRMHSTLGWPLGRPRRSSERLDDRCRGRLVEAEATSQALCLENGSTWVWRGFGHTLHVEWVICGRLGTPFALWMFDHRSGLLTLLAWLFSFTHRDSDRSVR